VGPFVPAYALGHGRNACLLLQQPAGLYCQVVECHLEFGYGLAEFGMISDLFLQVLKNLVCACNMLCSLDWILLGLGFARFWHGHLLPAQFNSIQDRLYIGRDIC